MRTLDCESEAPRRGDDVVEFVDSANGVGPIRDFVGEAYHER